ncbi:histidine kinase N-terminal 7TM domain-containing protein [Haloarcula sp. 1CSR25-25]|uniref:sensor histidine kinase n=1 Tax=Haloarcula sp. 1CSR25-25 TaxID=2862545 RepID=UPI002894DABB|nr:histidine kinase N-terminal 7TM domain-containing protein [Haloarcula sp. 1CSR25-25]MDT3433437.1 ATP-binding protein [Haloarcula sp. 1CSR25-25]
MELTAALLAGGILAVGGILGVGVGYAVRYRRDHPAAKPLSMMAIPPGLAGLCTAGLVVVPQPPLARVLLAAATGLLLVTPAYFLLFTLVYTGHRDLITRRRRRLLVALYGTIGAVAMVEPLVLADITVQTVNGLTFPVMDSRPVIVLTTLVFVYPLIAVCLWLLSKFLIAPGNIYRRQTAVILGAVCITVVGNVVFEAGFSPHPGLNLTAVFFSAEGALIALALFRFDFLSVEPLAPEIVLEEMNDPVIVLDESETLIDANPAATRLLGDPAAIGTPIRQSLPGLLAAAQNGEEYVHSSGPAAVTDGGEIDVYDLNDTSIYDQYDRSRGRVVVLRDISLRKQRERTLASLQSVSQQFLGAETAQEVLEIAVTAADDLLEYPYSGAMMYDAEANVLEPAVFADALAAAYEDADRASDPIIEPGPNDIWQVFESGEPRRGAPIEAPESELPVEVGNSLLYPLGDHGVLGISAGPDHDGFSDDDCRFADTLATTTENALDRVEKEQELRESRELVEMRSQQIRFFNSALRHDLLNGLMVVQGQIDRLDVDGEAADRVDTIDEWTEDLARMAREVRSVIQTITGEAGSDMEAVDIGAVVAEKAAKFRRGHDALTVTVETGALPAVWADSLLASVVENLFRNAVEHNDAEAPAIAVSASVGSETVTLRIADNGPGITDEMKEVIFEEAVTSETSGSVGFGLYFVRVMVDRYGGDIWFEDREDGAAGAVAVLELPIADAAG